MSIFRKFKQIGDIPSGELVMKLPEIDFRMPYSKGRVYINSKNNTGKITLAIKNIIPKETGEPKDETDTYIRQFAEELNNPPFQTALKKYLAKHDYPIFYSNATDGTEIVSIPGMSNKYQINDLEDYNIVVATYPINHFLNNNKLYKSHSIATGERKLISNESRLEEKISNLAQKVSDIYDIPAVRDIIESQIGEQITFTKGWLCKRVEAFDRFFSQVDAEAEIRRKKYEGKYIPDMFDSLEAENRSFGITCSSLDNICRWR